MIGLAVLALTMIGTALCFWFLVIHRPSNYFAPRSVSAMGWELIAFLVFLRSDITLIFTHANAYSGSGGTARAFFGILSLALIDMLMLFKLRSFIRFRDNYETETQRLERESDRQQ